MKAFLMYKDRDFDPNQKLPANEWILTQDLELNTLFSAMARDDKFLFDVSRHAILSAMSNGVDTILYRQAVLRDCQKNAELVKSIYALALDTIEKEKKVYYGFFGKYPAAVLSRAIEVLQMFIAALKSLRATAEQHAGEFESEGFRNFFAMLKRELSDEYFEEIQGHLKTLKFRNGVLVSAQLGQGNKGTHYVLRQPAHDRHGWLKRLLPRRKSAFSITIAERDENGARALSELKDRGINMVANALAQSTDHILSFFTLLQAELAFYIACLNLHDTLSRKQEPLCLPIPVGSAQHVHGFRGLYDVCLSLHMSKRVVGNDFEADPEHLLIVTGANQGGKSTFLRSIGLSQLMMQCGMHVPAEFYTANVCDGLYTHYKREEDATMKSGKLDEELSRMNDIVEQITPHAMVLFNESFAATNEREGSEISRQITRALLEQGIKIVFVTHMYEYAHDFYERRLPGSWFLRAQRESGGARSFKLEPGEPLKTGYGEDLYSKIFKAPPLTADTAMADTGDTNG
ncbi:MutS-related protein [Candidimonas nitroreducens]|uniref:DNA mismatch repair protein MutS n=1 Tax=Candidimonas nitroreducens TaxID=683354 RepID=A0A225N2K5_9BURK|nr:DNA mismatch repair protein MutS [Candidimonas nitroreducens]OWT66330.1 DNA mismatch repair protein MutS [Candidimonas nitroreducens]